MLLYIIDDLLCNRVEVSPGKWVIARPINYKYRSITQRIKEAWAVFTGEAEAVKFLSN